MALPGFEDLYPKVPGFEDLYSDGFGDWYARQAKRWNLSPDPDDPLHHYDYRAAFEAGAEPDESGHWPSRFKSPDHPNRFVGGLDTTSPIYERLRRTRERFGGNVAPGLNDPDEEEETWRDKLLDSVPGAFTSNVFTTIKKNAAEIGDFATKAAMSRGMGAPERGPLTGASERATEQNEEAMVRAAGAGLKAGMPDPMIVGGLAAANMAGNLADPLELIPGGAAAAAVRALRGGKTATQAAKVAREVPKGFEDLVDTTLNKIGRSSDVPTAAKKAARVEVDSVDGPTVELIALAEDGERVGSMTFFKEPGGGFRVANVEAGGTRGSNAMRLMYRQAKEMSGGPRMGAVATSPDAEGALAHLRETDPDLFPPDDHLSASDLPISRKAGALRPPETPFQYNAATLDMPEGQLDTVKEVMESADVAAQRRAGIQIDYNDTTRLQEELGLTEKDFLDTEPGTVYNREQGVLLDAYIGKYGRVVEALRPRVVSGVATPAEELAFNQARARQVDLLGVSMGNRSEIARAMESYKHLRTALGSTEDLRAYLSTKFLKLKEAGKVTDADLDLLAKADLDNPEELSDMILKINKSKWWEQLTEVFKSFILSGLGTHGRNAVGNSLMTAVAVPVKIGQAIIESPKALVGAKREAYFSEIMPMVYGGIEGVSDGWKRAVVSWQRGATEGSKFDIAHGGALRRSGSKIVRKKVAPAVEIPFRILTFTDEFFKGMNGEMFARSEAVKRGINEGLSGDELTDFVSKFLKDPPEDFIKAKVKYEKFQTFQSELGHSAKRWQKAIQSTPGVEGIIPFFRTPVNLFKRGLEFTPINTPRGLLKMLKGDPDAADQLARSALGSAMMAFTWSKAQKGEITGPVPKDQEKAAQFWAEKKEPFSIRVGDRWYPVGQIEPLAMPFAMMASYTEGVKNEEVAEASNWNKLSIGMGYMLSNQLDRSYLSGLSELMRMTTQGEGTTVERLSYTGAQQLSAATVPFSGLMEDVAQLADEGHPLRRKDKLSHHWMAKIPGLRDNLPLRQEPRFGGPITRTKWEVLGPTGTPVVPSRVTDDEITLRLRDLGITVGLPTKSVEGVRLSDEEYEDWLAYVGPKTKNMVGQMIFDDGFAQLPEHVRQESLDRFITNAVTNPAKVEAMMGLVPEIPPLVLRKQLKGAVDQFKSSRSVISARYNDTHRRPGSTSVSELFETAQEAEEDWKQSYAFIVEQARLVRAEGMERDKVIEFLRKQGVSNRVARAVAYGKDMSYEQYRKRAGGF